MNEDLKCKRCGLCCYLLIDGQPSDKKCPNLIILKDSRYFCRVYKSRIGRSIGEGNKCVKRIESPYDYEDCPYNEGNKPIVKLSKEGKHYVVFQESKV